MGITDDNLLGLAGSAAFERGYDYYWRNLVGDLEMRGGHTVALVSGTNLYRVELRYGEAELDGSCDCPASHDIVFCKHCVATALKFRDHLSESALAESCLNTKDLKNLITQATPRQVIYEWEAVSAYFRRLAATLQGIGKIVDQLEADVLLEISLHGINRLNKALEYVDDSGGYREHVQAILRELHGRALLCLDWSPQQRGDHLLDLVLADPWDQFACTPSDYSEVLGSDGLNAFYSAVEAQLQALPELPTDADFEDKLPYHRLTNLLMKRASEKDDYEEMIRLEELTATSAIDFARIAGLCLENGDIDAVAEWLSRADGLDEHDRRERKILWASVYAARGEWEAAVVAREAAFRKEATYADYLSLMELAEKAGYAKVVKGSAMTFLRSEDRPEFWATESYALTLAQIFRDEEDWMALKEIVLGRVSDPDSLLNAARWLAEPAPAEAGPVYIKAVDAFVAKKTNRCYRAAADTLLEAKPVIDATGASVFDDCMARLRKSHYRKRNLMAALDEAIRRS